MSYPSCNAILAAADLYLPLQDTGATTSLEGGGTLVGGNTAADLTTTGPGSSYPLAINFGGSVDYITTTVAAPTGASPRTVFGWVKTDNTTSEKHCIRSSTSGGNGQWFVWTCESGFRFRHLGGNRTYGSASTSWRHVAIIIPDSATLTSDAIVYIDGSSAAGTQTAGSAQTLNTSAANWFLGSTGLAAFDGALAGMGAIHEALDATDVANLQAGQEPTYTSGATLSEAGAWNVGTWDAYSNGSLTYSVVAAEADGTPVDTGSGATGTLDLSSAAGELVYLYVRASNNGGYDVGDFATRTGAYGSAADGYYEVASVTAAGGGGGSALPAIAHHYRQLMCA